MSAGDKTQEQGPFAKDRVIRVFVSSTFREMMWERDLFVNEVFSQLCRKCAKRFVTLTEVDPHWGITKAQANDGRVLQLCLAEIERNRPYVIGRTANMHLLHNNSVQSGYIGVLSLVNALGGLGKSALAIQCGHVFAGRYGERYWQVPPTHRTRTAGAQRIYLHFTKCVRRVHRPILPGDEPNRR
jgi:hypothetical protein